VDVDGVSTVMVTTGLAQGTFQELHTPEQHEWVAHQMYAMTFSADQQPTQDHHGVSHNDG
jgi:hypothetical protein